MDYIKVEWEGIEDLIDECLPKIDAFKPDVIVGFARGGLIPGVIVSHRLNLPFRSVEWTFRDDNVTNMEDLGRLSQYKRIAMIDDIIDSGKTIADFTVALKGAMPRVETFVATLFFNPSNKWGVGTNALGTIIDRKVDERWVHFPWES